MHTRDEAELTPAQEGPGPGHGRRHHTSITTSRCVNPDHVIANLTKAGELNMTLKVERGRGYRPATQRLELSRSRPARSAGCSSTPRSARCAA